MPKTKYSIIDDSDNIIGFVVVEAPRFEHTTPISPIQIDGPIADVVLLFGSLIGFTGIPYIFGADWLSPVIGVSITAVLAAIKARYGTVMPVTDQADPPGVHITGEFNSTDGTKYFDEIKSPSMDMDALRSMCDLIAKNDFVWVGRPTAKKKGVSRTQHEIIRDEFYRLDYLGHGPAGVEPLLARGRLFVRKVNNLPK